MNVLVPSGNENFTSHSHPSASLSASTLVINSCTSLSFSNLMKPSEVASSNAKSCKCRISHAPRGFLLLVDLVGVAGASDPDEAAAAAAAARVTVLECIVRADEEAIRDAEAMDERIGADIVVLTGIVCIEIICMIDE